MVLRVLLYKDVHVPMCDFGTFWVEGKNWSTNFLQNSSLALIKKRRLIITGIFLWFFWGFASR